MEPPGSRRSPIRRSCSISPRTALTALVGRRARIRRLDRHDDAVIEAILNVGESLHLHIIAAGGNHPTGTPARPVRCQTVQGFLPQTPPPPTTNPDPPTNRRRSNRWLTPRTFTTVAGAPHPFPTTAATVRLWRPTRSVHHHPMSCLGDCQASDVGDLGLDTPSVAGWQVETDPALPCEVKVTFTMTSPDKTPESNLRTSTSSDTDPAGKPSWMASTARGWPLPAPIRRVTTH